MKCVYEEVFECTELSADRNSSSAVPGLWPHISCRSSAESAYHHPLYSPDFAPSDFHLFLHLKKLLSGLRQRFGNDREAEMSVKVVLIPGGRVLRHRVQHLYHGMTNVSIPEVNILKNNSSLAICVQINFSIKLDFVFVHGLR